MLGVNKTILPLLVWAAACYVASQWFTPAWMLIPVVLPPYFYASSEHFANKLYGSGMVCSLPGINAVSGMIPKKFIKVSDRAWNSKYREALLDHEKGHVLGAHSVFGLAGIVVYAAGFMMGILLAAPAPVMLVLATAVFFLQYAMFTFFELQADQYAIHQGRRCELIGFLESIAPKSFCNSIRLQALK